MKKLRVGVLGATGLVGQHYVRLLQEHPLFEIAFLAASPESAGRNYSDVLLQKGPLFDGIRVDREVYRIDEIDRAQELCDFVFSAVGGDVAKRFEPLYAAAGLPVLSNASSHRGEPDVPLLIPEVNPEHLRIIPVQQKNRGWDKGFIVAKPNCSLQSYMIPLYPLHQKFGVKKLVITTLQAVSGAGHPGISSLNMIDNIVPYIAGEEEKSEIEPLKIFGKIEGTGIQPAQGISISAHCNRVPVLDGHTACVSVLFEKKPDFEEVLQIWKEFRGLPQQLKLPSAPLQPLLYRQEKDRPQPRLDRQAEGGMAVTLGRLRDCPVFHYRFVALSHNALRGAAMGGVLNAELLQSQGYL